MKMTIRFDKEKLKKYDLTEEAALAPIKVFFAENGITETSIGVFENLTKQDKFAIFGCSSLFPDNYTYFMDCIKKWEWYSEEDGTDDCIATHYKLQEILNHARQS
ncbi:MAG: hypothetical protein ACTTIR_07630 [Eggerthia catenaformis]|uniref:hypothetical protein n=1 Tax=Eggerthia catenaformis TaxID=31973 RepID=UPI00248E9549|nr:hypothetical protein [Eggerthia catenaformis]